MLELPAGQTVLIDPEDMLKVQGYRWRVDKHGYVACCRYSGGVKHTLKLHRIVTDAPTGMDVDHISHDLMDNRKSNLRIVTHQQNLQNNQGKKQRPSKFKGIGFFQRTGKWTAQIGLNGRKIHLGYFTAELDAARAYNAAASEMFGQQACLNPI